MGIKIGDTFSTTREVTDEVVRKFAEVSGDFNPLHLDEEFAKTTRFGRRVAHGMLGASYISAVLGNEFHGKTVIYLSQALKFTAPVYIGDTVTATATITAIREDKNIVTLATNCTNQNGETLITGESVAMVLP
jgi:3-hydroxybutyryl-CoA dehydratase